MRVKSIKAIGFKRFHDLTITDIPVTARLVVLTGPNGCGKSSLFDAMRVWHLFNSGQQIGEDAYYPKKGATWPGLGSSVRVEWHDPLPTDQRELRKMLYIRSAYRTDEDFTVQRLERAQDFVQHDANARLIDTDYKVANNYGRLVSSTIAKVFLDPSTTKSNFSLREDVIASIRDPLKRVFPELTLTNLGDPMRDGSFYFTKGVSADFHYKNLSGGEKAALNLVLDLAVKTSGFDNTCFCIDEPELHLNSRVQAALLVELLRMLPGQSQLWIASHSIGMMRGAKELHQANPAEVCFLDFEEVKADEAVVLHPAKIDRGYWKRILQVALDDAAALVAPATIVLCEGMPGLPGVRNSGFDAKCYRAIFGSGHPDVDFVSVGSSLQVQDEAGVVGHSFQSLLAGVRINRISDRDDLSPAEIATLSAKGVRVLQRRHLEAYLLSDEMVEALCASVSRPGDATSAKQLMATALQNSVARGNPPDDYKSASGEFYVGVKRLLGLTACGNDAPSFLRDTMAPLMTPTMVGYQELSRIVL